MKTDPLDRLLRSAASAPERELPELDRGLENRVLAAVRAAQRAGDPTPLLRVLRLGLAMAGATAVFTVLLALGSPQSAPLVTIEDTFAAPEPEAYLALQ